MKRLMMTAAALALLMTAAQAQMLQPVPMTAEQTEFYNFAVVATYATNCGADKARCHNQRILFTGRTGDQLKAQPVRHGLHAIDRGVCRRRKSVR